MFVFFNEMKKEIYIGIDKRKIKAVMPSSFFLFCWGVGLYFPIPKERKLIEKVIEFDQSIEAHLRERDLCSEWV